VIEERLRLLIHEAADKAASELGVEGPPEQIELTRPPQKRFGDFSTNLALRWGSMIKRNPAEVAAAIRRNLAEPDFLSGVEVAGIGFINFYVTHGWLHDVLREIVMKGDQYGRAERTGQRVQVEFVSPNPTGPLHVGTARGGALGDGIASMLDAAGWTVHRECYLNDAGRQMDLFAASVEARYLEQFDRPAEIPEGGYRGEYLVDVARSIAVEFSESLLELPPDERRERFLAEGSRRVLDMIRSTLSRFGVQFDTYFSERHLHESGAIQDAVDRLKREGHAYESEGAVWFRSTDFGDDKDRVLIRGNGQPTYFAADCAYLVNKFARGFDHLVYVWGADHHGDVKRVKGATQALGYDPDQVEIVLYQLVALYRAGEPVRMAKRTGEMITLDELIDEVGKDAARYTLLARSQDTPIDFDIEVVTRQSLDNPVYYVQYAHARIASILRHAAEQGIEPAPIETAQLDLLTHESELGLLRRLSEMPEEVEVAANLRAPYRMTHFAEELAGEFHHFYTDCRVVTDDPALTQARLWLCVAAKQVVANVLRLLGVSAPESMERVDE
jgi:arginyl-tRNA synthetase